MKIWTVLFGAGLLAAGSAGAQPALQSAPESPSSQSDGTGPEGKRPSSGKSTEPPPDPGSKEGRSEGTDRASGPIAPAAARVHRPLHPAIPRGFTLAGGVLRPLGFSGVHPPASTVLGGRSQGAVGCVRPGTALWTALSLGPGHPGGLFTKGAGPVVTPASRVGPAISRPPWRSDPTDRSGHRFLINGSEIRPRPSGIDGNALGPRHPPAASTTLSGTEVRPKH